MNNYEYGFMHKCAEYGLTDKMAETLYKEAISKADYDEMYDRLAKEYGMHAKDYGYSQFLGDAPEKAGFWGRLWRRNKTVHAKLQKEFQRRKAKALEQHDKMVSNLSADDRVAYLEGLGKSRASAARARLLQGLDPETRAIVEKQFVKNKPTSAQLYIPVHAYTPSTETDRYGVGMFNAIRSGRLSIPSYSSHSINPNTGEFYRKDGRELHPGAVQWNMRLRYNGPDLKPNQPVPASK